MIKKICKQADRQSGQGEDSQKNKVLDNKEMNKGKSHVGKCKNCPTKLKQQKHKRRESLFRGNG